MKEQIYAYLKHTPHNTNFKILDQMMNELSAKTILSEKSQLEVLIETDMLPVVHNVSGAILTDEKGNIILRY